MTPRLRMLSIGLALSLAYAIYDYVDRTSEKKTVVTKSKKKKRARTAGVSASRAENLKRRLEQRREKRGESTTKSSTNNFKPESGFLPISDEINKLYKDKEFIDKILNDGAEKANKIASKKVSELKKIVGF